MCGDPRQRWGAVTAAPLRDGADIERAIAQFAREADGGLVLAPPPPPALAGQVRLPPSNPIAGPNPGANSGNPKRNAGSRGLGDDEC